MINLQKIKTIAIDFDGTVVTHEYPKIGRYIGAEPVLKELLEKGIKLVLNTMRSGKELDEAVQWFKERDISLYGINENPDQKSWTTSPKPWAQLYIDDAALGVPLCNGLFGERPYVDWDKVKELLFNETLNNEINNEINTEFVKYARELVCSMKK